MSGLACRLTISAGLNGLFLQPSGHSQSPTDQDSGINIEYGTNTITTASQRNGDSGVELETHGIVGLLNLVTSSYLIAITRRKEVAKIREQPIFLVRDIALIPLSSKSEAQTAISNAQRLLKQNEAAPAPAAVNHVTEDELDAGEETETGSVNEEPEDTRLPQKQNPEDEAKALELPRDGKSAIATDIVQNKGKYGRFVSKWFGKNGNQTNAKRAQGLSDAEDRKKLGKEQVQQQLHASPQNEVEDVREDGDAQHKQEQDDEPGENAKRRTSTEQKRQSAIEYLAPRILKSARLYFSSSGFYFSYHHDLSMSMSRQTRTDGPVLWERFDPLFFWNRHLMRPFTDAGQDAIVLPLIQGFVGQRSFSIAQVCGDERDKHDLAVTLISRRSVKRAGLRYLRRGIDDDGNVANSVETEQIMSYESWSDQEKAFSLVQTRGSMPLFFSQSPYSFKPMPVLFGSESTNQAAMKRHFSQLLDRYGNVQAASLVDKHGTEVGIGEKYQAGVEHINEKDGLGGNHISFDWFDFHGACKGMKFENVSILLNTLQGFLESSGWTVRQGGASSSQQTGILRTNCMDCLDRTNVVQSAVAGWALEKQLAELGLSIDLKSDPKTQWFNTLWADNGDAISKQYAGTQALKGDFTRTRKRNITGALTDFSLTLNRYYNNIFGDYFLQTNIDYLLGAGPHVFDEFETDMTSKDYALDMSNVRKNAIDTCIKVVLEDPKDPLTSAWTLASPKCGNTLGPHDLEECVLLLTQTALYLCRFDWNTEKVGSFEKVDLLDIKEIWRGAYITSALGASHLDETKNFGFVIRYADRGPEMRRTNTRSMRVAAGAEHSESETKHETDPSEADSGEARILAFKALSLRAKPGKDVQDGGADSSEVEATRKITNEIQTAVVAAVQQDQGTSDQAPGVQEHDVISAAEARKSTGYVESIGYSLKKLVWS